jgi:pimeloyl-ACP methyl ester carboxylesterase
MRIHFMRARRILIGVLATVVVLGGALGIVTYRAIGTFAVEVPESLSGDEPGALVAVERIGKYPRFAAKYILNSIDLPESIEVKCGITVYRLRYRTTNYDGSPVIASGLLALPETSALNTVVAYHHGTNCLRRDAPSQPGLGEGLLVAAATAGSGHVLVAPDYIGLGESRDIHPYMHSRVTASASIDCLRAARGFVEHLRGHWPTALFLLGFSQGGHATFAVQQELEKARDPRFHVKASAPIAGPFHLREVSFPQALTGTSHADAFYLAYIANSYAHVYGQPLASVLVSPYLERVPSLFDGDHQPRDIEAALPKNPRDLFTFQLLEAYDNARPFWFLDALKENSVAEWTPIAPIRIYYGDKDLDVLPEEARRAEAAMRGRGADVQAVSVGPVDHEASAIHAVPQALRWFNVLVDDLSP